jgi:hypothetical protein
MSFTAIMDESGIETICLNVSVSTACFGLLGFSFVHQRVTHNSWTIQKQKNLTNAFLRALLPFSASHSLQPHMFVVGRRWARPKGNGEAKRRKKLYYLYSHSATMKVMILAFLLLLPHS